MTTLLNNARILIHASHQIMVSLIIRTQILVLIAVLSLPMSSFLLSGDTDCRERVNNPLTIFKLNLNFIYRQNVNFYFQRQLSFVV